MRKLKLDLDELAVQTFATDEQPEEAGTVRGLEGSGNLTCDEWVTCKPQSCPGISCDDGCGSEAYDISCDYSCNYTCTCMGGC